MCAIYVVLLCVCRFGLGWAHDVFTFARHMLMHFHAYIPSFSYIIIYFVLVLFRLYLCLSLSLSFYVCLLLWHPMRSKAYSSSDPTPSSVQFYDENAWKDFLENFCRRGIPKAFIWNATSFCQTFLTLTYPLSFTVRVGSHFVTSGLLVSPWSYKSFTPICTKSIHQYHISSFMFEVRTL